MRHPEILTEQERGRIRVNSQIYTFSIFSTVVAASLFFALRAKLLSDRKKYSHLALPIILMPFVPFSIMWSMSRTRRLHEELGRKYLSDLTMDELKNFDRLYKDKAS